MPTHQPQKPRWSEEASRTASNWVAAVIVLVTAAAAVLPTFTNVVPDRYRAQYATIVGGLGIVAAALTKIQGEVTRRNVWSSDSHYTALNEVAQVVAQRTGEPGPETEHQGEPPIKGPVGPVIPIPGDPGPSGQAAQPQPTTWSATTTADAPQTAPTSWRAQTPRPAADPDDPAYR